MKPYPEGLYVCTHSATRCAHVPMQCQAPPHCQHLMKPYPEGLYVCTHSATRCAHVPMQCQAPTTLSTSHETLPRRAICLHALRNQMCTCAHAMPSPPTLSTSGVAKFEKTFAFCEIASPRPFSRDHSLSLTFTHFHSLSLTFTHF
jgi:hypothetical protein